MKFKCEYKNILYLIKINLKNKGKQTPSDLQVEDYNLKKENFNKKMKKKLKVNNMKNIQITKSQLH